uniref:Ribosomal protein L19 n=1 Tax=Rhizophora mucronata TaxID=61149 RepID=A0A2P2JVG9_RHIMU
MASLSENQQRFTHALVHAE